MKSVLDAHGRRKYPFPLQDGSLAWLHLPPDLTAEDAERLGVFFLALVIEREAAS